MIINNENLIFKKFHLDDYNELDKLQSQLFPIRYPISFYKKLLNESSVSVLVWLKNSCDNSSNIENLENTVMIDNSNNENNELIRSHNNTIQSQINQRNNNSNLELIGVATGTIKKDTGLVSSLFYTIFEGYIMTFGIKEKYRSKGLGTLLLNSICDQLFKRACCKITLHVKVGNTNAYKFYLKNDFIVSEEIADYYNINLIKYNSLKMVRSLKNYNINHNNNNNINNLDIDNNLDGDSNSVIKQRKKPTCINWIYNFIFYFFPDSTISINSCSKLNV